MEKGAQDGDEARELRSLIERIKRGNCVLVLGPRVAIPSESVDGRPFDELLAKELLANIRSAECETKSAPNLRRAAESYLAVRDDRVELEIAVRDFYQREAASTTAFHRDLAALPFRICVCTSPDDLMLRAFEAEKKVPQRGYYNFNERSPRLVPPTRQRPLVYHLFGHYDVPESLVLTEGDLIEFLVAVVKGAPSVSDQVRSILADATASFLFLGFGFQNWYLRVLLHVMNVYGHRNKPFAFEDSQFFEHPDHDQVVGFFSGKRVIQFRPFRWEVFAKQLREAYEAAAPSAPAELPSGPESGPGPSSPDAPRAFICYASEDRDAVATLAEQLEEQGIRVWRDVQYLRAGDNWRRVLMDVIKRLVDYCIVVHTPAMMESTEGVFKWEIDEALERQAAMGEFDGQQLRFIIPVHIGACEFFSALRTYHVTDVGTLQGVEAVARSIHEDWKKRAIRKSRSQAVA